MIAGMLAPSLLNRTGPFPELLAIQKALEDSGEFREVKVMLQTSSGDRTTGLHLTVTCRNKPTDYEQAGARIVAVVEKADPQAAQRDFIAVDFKEGFQAGLATFSNSRHVSHSPQQWEEILQSQAR